MPPSAAPTFIEIKEAIQKVGETFDAYKKVNDERLEAVRSGNETKARELDTKLTKIETDLSKASELKQQFDREIEFHRERLEELESRRNAPGRTAAEQRQDEYKNVFVDWIRNKGQSTMDETKLQELTKQMVEKKDITIGTGSAGGFAVPEVIAREIERLELLFSPVRKIVKVVPTGTSDYKELVSLRGATSGWVGETGTRSATLTPTLREVTPTNGELYAYPQVSEWSLDDIFFNVEQWLADEVAQEFAVQEGQAVVDGNGTSKPTGMLNTVPVSTADFASPLRAAAAYQFISSSTGTSPAAPVTLAQDSLLDVVYKLRSQYRAGAFFVMNSATTALVRKLKDSQNQYLWQPGLAAGQPNQLLGFTLETWEQMQDVAVNKFPVAFGNFRRGYLLTQRVGMRVTRDNVTNIGFVRFYVRRREGGIVLNNDAIKWIKTVD